MKKMYQINIIMKNNLESIITLKVSDLYVGGDFVRFIDEENWQTMIFWSDILTFAYRSIDENS